MIEKEKEHAQKVIEVSFTVKDLETGEETVYHPHLANVTFARLEDMNEEGTTWSSGVFQFHDERLSAKNMMAGMEALTRCQLRALAGSLGGLGGLEKLLGDLGDDE